MGRFNNPLDDVFVQEASPVIVLFAFRVELNQ